MKIFKKHKEYFYTFFFSVLLIVALYLLLGIKINNKSLLFSDSIAQYYPLLIFFKKISLYTFKIGGGMGMIATIAYYLMSPFNLLVFIVSNLQDAIALITILKLSLASLTMYIYLDQNYPHEKKLYKYLFSVSYMLCSWATKFYYCFIWLDVFYLLPLIILGIDNLFKEKPSYLYLISLFCAMIFQYYLSYMVCFFSVLYFVYKLLIIKPKNRKLLIKKFLTYSILAGLLSSFILYPTFIAMQNVNRFDWSTLTFGFYNVDVLKGLFFGNNDYSLQTYIYAHLYTGVFNILLIVLYFFNNKISGKKKKYTAIMFGIFILSLLFKPLYFMWHAFSQPYGIPARFSFIVCFFIIIIAYRSFIKIGKLDYKKIIISLLIIICCYLLMTGNYSLAFVNLALMLLYLLFIHLSHFNKNYLLLLFFISLFELFGSAYLSMLFPIQHSISYDLINTYIGYQQESDASFYRTGQVEFAYGFSGVTGNYNNMGYYLSTNSNSIRYFVKKAEYNYNNNYYNYYENTSEFLNMFYDEKYLLDRYDYSNYKEIGTYQNMDEEGKLDNYKVTINDDYYGIGTLVNDNILLENNNTGLEYQNKLFNLMTGLNGNIYEEIKPVNNKYEINQDFYISFENHYFGKEDFLYKYYENGIYADEYVMNSQYSSVLRHRPYIGTLEYTIKADKDYKIDAKIYKFNKDLFEQGVQILKDNAMMDVTYYDGYVKGSVDVNDNHILFTSIPYEKGWSAYVDGNKTDILKISDGFIGIKLDSGKHVVEFKYETPGLKTGIIISIISLMCLIYLIRKEKI